MESFRDVIGLWNTRVSFAADVGVSTLVAQQWWNRDSIPSASFNDVLAGAKRAGHQKKVTAQLLLDLAQRRRANDKRQAAAQ